jgi:tol-pal system protein YbgF
MKKYSIIIMTLGVVLTCAACVSTQEYAYQQQVIRNLQAEVRDLQEQNKLREMKTEGLINQTRSSVPAMRNELDKVKEEVQRLTNAIDLTEQGAGQAGIEPMTLPEQAALTRARLDRIEAKLRLPPLSRQVVAAAASAAQTESPSTGPNIEVRQPTREVPPDEKAYGEAKTLFNRKEYAESRNKFETFLSDYPNSKYAGSAQFHQGEAYFLEGDYEGAILEYQKVVKNYSKDENVSIALLKQAYSFLNIGDEKSAALLFRKLIREYPKSHSAQVAKQKLEELN